MTIWTILLILAGIVLVSIFINWSKKQDKEPKRYSNIKSRSGKRIESNFN